MRFIRVVPLDELSPRDTKLAICALLLLMSSWC